MLKQRVFFPRDEDEPGRHERQWPQQWVAFWVAMSWGSTMDVEKALNGLEGYDSEWAADHLRALYDTVHDRGDLERLDEKQKLHFKLLKAWLAQYAIKKVLKSVR